MKKIFYTILTFGSLSISAQVSTNQPTVATSTNENVFLDAASNFNQSANSSPSIGKGLGFPQTNLTTFKFITTNLDGVNYPSYYDGMVVYNTATGSTNDSALTTQTTGLTPGFYYFSNPNGATNGSVSAGKWVKLGGADAAALAGQFWAINGNSGVPAANAKIGTTDNVPVQMISNGVTYQTYGASTSDASFRKVVINPNGSTNTTMAKSKTVGGTGFDFALEVAGKSWFENGIVTSNSTYPDYVFDKYFTGKSKENAKYNFLTLAETEKYIKENNHLPGVTSINDLAKGGNGYMIDATQLSVQSLEKIEELYLHTIEQQKEIDALKAEIKAIKASLK